MRVFVYVRRLNVKKKQIKTIDEVEIPELDKTNFSDIENKDLNSFNL